MEEIRTTPMFQGQADLFLSDYECEKTIVCPDEKMKTLSIKSLRVCRFCKKKFGEVTFQKEAHIFPVALGNEFLISNFECDTCNHKFGSYENDLCRYLGIERTFNRTPGRKNIPNFISDNIRATKESIFDQPGAIKIEPNNGQVIFGYDEATQSRTITYKKRPYSPINVYKAILKMALCCIDKSDVKSYDLAFKFLTTTELDGKFKPCYLFGYRVPGNYDVFATLYRKRHSSLKTMTHTFILYYGSFMLQIFLPFNTDDRNHYPHFQLPIMPPLFDGSGDEKWMPHYTIQDDVSSPEKRIDEEEVIRIKVDPEHLDKIVGIDPITREVVNRRAFPSEVSGLYLVDKDFKLPISLPKAD